MHRREHSQVLGVLNRYFLHVNFRVGQGHIPLYQLSELLFALDLEIFLLDLRNDDNDV
jgi:hypothetical protein